MCVVGVACLFWLFGVVPGFSSGIAFVTCCGRSLDPVCSSGLALGVGCPYVCFYRRSGFSEIVSFVTLLLLTVEFLLYARAQATTLILTMVQKTRTLESGFKNTLSSRRRMYSMIKWGNMKKSEASQPRLPLHWHRVEHEFLSDVWKATNLVCTPQLFPVIPLCYFSGRHILYSRPNKMVPAHSRLPLVKPMGNAKVANH